MSAASPCSFRLASTFTTVLPELGVIGKLEQACVIERRIDPSERSRLANGCSDQLSTTTSADKGTVFAATRPLPGHP